MRLFSSQPAKKRALVLLLHATIALTLGLAVYLIFRPDAAIARVIYRLLGVETAHFRFAAGKMAFIRFYSADFLWSYALTFALNIVSIETPGKTGAMFALSIFIGCMVELLQGVGIIIGTYDPKDIMIQICAALIAETIVLFIFRKEV